MPIYEYKLLGQCPFCPARFEQFQNVDDAPLTRCTACDLPCKRVVSLPAIKKYDRGHGGVLNAANLERQGMARWEKRGNGVYERTAGTDENGPRYLFKDGTVAE